MIRHHTPASAEDTREALHGLYLDAMEALEDRDYRKVEATADEALAAAGLPTGSDRSSDQTGGPDTPAEVLQQARLQYRKLCDALLRARAALAEASADPYFDGQLQAPAGAHVSMVRRILEERLESSSPAGPGQAPAALPAGQAAPSQAQAPAGPRLSEAVEAYCKAKAHDWSPSSQIDLPPHLKQFADIVSQVVAGSDIAITDLTRDHVRGYCETMRALPRRVNVPKYQNKSYAKLVKLDLPAGERLADKTLSTRFTTARSFIKWAGNEYGIEAGRLNDAFTMPKGIKSRGPAGASSREGFTVPELSLIFDPGPYLEATAKSPSRFWAPIISLFTGMRLKEICQLGLEDLRQAVDDEHALGALPGQQAEPEKGWVFDVNDEGENKHVKTQAGKRVVPVHPFLLDALGLLDYQARARGQAPDGGRLFPALVANGKGDLGHAVGSWFTRYRRAQGIGGERGQISNKVFHSFRHTVIHHLLAQAQANIRLVQAVVGHEEKGADIGVTAVYAGRYPVTTLRDEVIMRLPWSEVLPRLPELAGSPHAKGGLQGTPAPGPVTTIS